MALKLINDIVVETDCILAVTPVPEKQQRDDVYAVILFSTTSKNANMSISKKTYDDLIHSINPG